MLLRIAGSRVPDMCRLAAAPEGCGLGGESFPPQRRITSARIIITSMYCELRIRRTHWWPPDISLPVTGFHHGTTIIFFNAKSIWYVEEVALTWNNITCSHASSRLDLGPVV
jgi:hypothetical protein